MYNTNLKVKWDNEFVKETAWTDGKEEGIKKGKKEEAIEIAREMKNDGMPLAQIAKFTKLIVEEIENL